MRELKQIDQITSRERNRLDAIPKSLKRSSATGQARQRMVVMVGLTLSYLIFIPAAGQLYPTEALLLVISIVSFLDPAAKRVPGWILMALGAWLAFSLVSDLANATDRLDAFKGVARVLFLSSNIVGLAYLTQLKWRASVTLWLAIAFGGVLSFFVFPNAFASGEPWKFGLGSPVSIIVAVLAGFKPGSRVIAPSMLMALAVVHFVLGTRSLALVCIVSALVLALQSGSHAGSISIARLKLLLSVVVAIVGAAVLTSTYDNLAKSGVLGPAALAKASYQASGAFGSLLGGRPEVELSVRSIFANPILGSGSFSTVSPYISSEVADFYTEWGYTNLARNIQDGGTPYHSELLGTWAENGAGAVLFWIVLLCLVLVVLVRVLQGRVAHAPLVVYISILALWDAFFSPFGADRRFWVAATIVLVISALQDEWGDGQREGVHRHDQFQPAAISATLR